jgi:DNA-binding transcriptional LysR family regulator
MMHGMQLSAVDVGLVVPLAALLEEQSVARAAKRIGLSPSATSHALGRLRELLGDPLLVRAGRRLVRTPRAETLREPARRAIAELEHVFGGEDASFDPATLRAGFRIATTDHVQLVLLRDVDRSLVRAAPHVDLFAVPLAGGAHAALRDGAADASIGVFVHVPDDFRVSKLFDDELVVVVRRGHPLSRGRITAERFAAADHVLVAPLGTPRGLVDDLLAKKRLSRRVARTLPTFVDAAHLVATTDYVAALPKTLVRRLARTLALRALHVPLALPRFTMSLLWHRRLDADRAHSWLRGVIASTATKIG